VLFDRICADRGIEHLLTAPRSPTTTGKVERWHKTLRREFLNDKTFTSITDAQAELDVWVAFYNHDRPHQSLGMAAPWERFRLAAPPSTKAADVAQAAPARSEPVPAVPSATRKVSAAGTISFASARYLAGRWLAGQTVQVVCEGGLVHLHHRGVLIATHARRHRPADQAAGLRRKTAPVGPSHEEPHPAAQVRCPGACLRDHLGRNVYPNDLGVRVAIGQLEGRGARPGADVEDSAWPGREPIERPPQRHQVFG
jgi:hypothetical protein